MTFNIIKYSIPFKEEMKKFVAFITREKQTKNECENNDSNFLRILQIVYKKLGQFFFPYILINFFKGRYISSVSVKSYKYLNKLITIKTMVWTILKILCIYMRKINIAHHSMTNNIYASIFPHTCCDNKCNDKCFSTSLWFVWEKEKDTVVIK